jgi:hypothetical protein
MAGVGAGGDGTLDAHSNSSYSCFVILALAIPLRPEEYRTAF